MPPSPLPHVSHPSKVGGWQKQPVFSDSVAKPGVPISQVSCMQHVLIVKEAKAKSSGRSYNDDSANTLPGASSREPGTLFTGASREP